MNEIIGALVGYIQQLGWLGPAAFAFVYTVSAVGLFPGSILTMLAGFVWGPFYGLAIASVSSMLASSATFALARTVLRSWTQRKIGNNRRFLQLDRTITESGFKVVVFTRLSPIFPYGPLNYAMGLTRVRFRDYFLGSWLGMFPATAMYAYIGSAARSIAAIMSGDVPASSSHILFWAGLAVTAGGSIYLARRARRTV